MEHLIKCARCGASLAEVADRSIVQTVCATCHLKYQVINGRLANKSSRQVTPEDESTRHDGTAQRDYELVLEIGDRRREVVSFTSDGPNDPLRSRRGDDILVVHSMRGKDLDELLYVLNLTNGEILTLVLPGDTANRSAKAMRYFVVFVFFAMAAVIGYSEPVGLGIGVVVAYVVSRSGLGRRRQIT